MDCPRGLVAPGRSAGAYRSQRGLGKAWREPWRFSQKDTNNHQHHHIGLAAKHAWIESFPQCWHEVCSAYFKGLMLTKYVNVSWHFLLQRAERGHLFTVAASTNFYFYRFNKYIGTVGVTMHCNDTWTKETSILHPSKYECTYLAAEVAAQ